MRVGWDVAAGFGIGLLLCVLPAMAGFLVIQVKRKRSVKPFLLGAAAFIVSQLLLRVPLLQSVLPRFSWYTVMTVAHPYWNWIFLGLTAGIFEETARWICIRFWLKKHRRFSDGIVFGLGHGGAEAALTVGITCLNLFLITFVLAGGKSLTEVFGISEAVAAQTEAQLQGMTFFDALAGGAERVLALLLQVGFTMLVFYGVRCGKGLRYLFAAILAHGFVDASIGFWQAAGVGGWALEGVFAVYAALLMVWVVWCKKDGSGFAGTDQRKIDPGAPLQNERREKR